MTTPQLHPGYSPPGAHHNDQRRCLAADAAGWVPDLELQEELAVAGARSGMWGWLPGRLQPGSIVWSAGVGDNVAWDLELIRRHGLVVHGMDPTPGSTGWVAEQRRLGALPETFRFHPVGLAGHDGEILLHPPKKRGKVNHHMAGEVAGAHSLPGDTSGLAKAAQPFPVRRVRTWMQHLGHSRIDLLKLDIEGAEFQVLEDLLGSDVRPDQLLVEFHEGPRQRSWWGRRSGHGRWWPRIGAAISSLRSQGYRLVWRSGRGLEFAFARSQDDVPPGVGPKTPAGSPQS